MRRTFKNLNRKFCFYTMWQETFPPSMPPHGFPQYPPPNIPLLPNAIKGHQIPMLSDNANPNNSSDFPYQQPPLEPIPPTPQATLPQTGGIDWTIISSCSPEELAETKDIETLTAIIQSFIHARFTQTEAQLMPNPLTSKFFRILQIAIQYLLECQAELKENLEESEKAEQLLQAKLKNLSASLIRAKDEVKKSQIIKETTEKCIVCGRRFKTIKYLDGHVQRRHGALMPAWRSLRTGELQGMNDFAEQIESLRQEVAKAHRELERRAEQEVQKAPVSHIVSHSDEQIRLIKELIERQDQMMNLARENEEKQLTFRREMRNQLDDAVVALQDAQKQLDIQATRIGQISLIPQPSENKPEEPIRPDELEGTLTEQIVKTSINDKRRITAELDKLLEGIIPTHPEGESVRKPSITTTITSPEKKDESKHKIEPDKSESENEEDEREKEHKKILNKLQGEEESATSNEDQFMLKPGKKTLSKREQLDELLRRAKGLVNHNVDPNESSNRDISLANITEATLHRVDVKLAELKRKRPYASLSPSFVAKKMDEGTKEYKKLYDKLSAFVGSEAPSISDEFKKNLFKERKTKFPLLPPIRKLTQKQLLAQRQRQKKSKTNEEDDGHHGVPKIPDEIMTEAANKFPFRQRIARNRPRLLPGDSDVMIVDKFSSEISSDSSVGYRDDPDYYKRYYAKGGAVGGKDKEFEEIHLSSGTTSSSIEPLKDGEDDTKVFNIDEFSDSSEDEKKKKLNKKKPVPKLDDTDSDSIIDMETINSKSKRKSGTDFEFEEEEEESDNFANTTQEISLKGLNKTKTIRFQTAGSGDFDVTKKQSLKDRTDSDDLFNVSDFSSDDNISPDEDDDKKKPKKKTKK